MKTVILKDMTYYSYSFMKKPPLSNDLFLQTAVLSEVVMILLETYGQEHICDT